MRFPTLIAAALSACGAAVGPASAQESCDFCSSGLSVPSATPVPSSGGETCGSLLEAAPDIEPDEYSCTVAKLAEDLCCPAGGDDDDADGDDDDVDEDEDDDGTDDAPDTDDIDADDDDDKEEEDTVAAGGAERPCPVCPNGLTVDGSTVIGRSGGRTFTCGELIVDALDKEEDSGTCANMLLAEEVCCPPGADDEEDEADDDEDDEVEDDNSDDADDEGDEDEDDIDAAGGGEEAPCPVCPNGVTVPGFTIISQTGGQTLTCGGLRGALEEEDDEDICASVMGAQRVCCPTGEEEEEEDEEEDDDKEDEAPGTSEDDEDAEAHGTCPVCVGGITVDADTVIREWGGRVLTCGTLIVDASLEDEDSEVCYTMRVWEQLCCPPGGPDEDEDADGAEVTSATSEDEGEEDDEDEDSEDDNSCPVCSDGITVDEDTVINESGGRVFTCGTLIVDALQFDNDSEVCADMLTWEQLCCPPSDQEENEDGDEEEVAPATATSEDGDGEDDDADEFCPVCSDGITVDADTVINESGGRVLTCGTLIVDALQFDKDSEVCAEMLTREGLCCPPGDDEEEVDGDDDESKDEVVGEDEDKEEEEPEATPVPSPAPQGTPSVPPTGAPVKAVGLPSPTALDVPNTESPFAVTFGFVSGSDDTEDTPAPTPAPSDAAVNFGFVGGSDDTEDTPAPTPAPSEEEEEALTPPSGPGGSESEGLQFQAPEPATLDEGASSVGVRATFAGVMVTSIVSVAYALSCI